MRLPRTFASFFVFTTLAVLAACGGGGGGGSVTPPGNGGNTGVPPAQPSGNPTPSTAPGATPTPMATATPSATPTPTPTPAAVKVSSTTYYLYEDVILGDRTWYTSGTASWSNNSGGTASAPTSQIDGMTCAPGPNPTTTYAQHAFVGIIFNGAVESLPQAIGLVNPKPPTTPYPGNPNGHKYNTDAVELEDCEFQMHTHDFSGLVHIEDPNQPQSTTAIMPYANLQALFDLWGAQLTANGIVAGASTLQGPVQIFTGVPTSKYTPSGSTKSVDLVNTYMQVNGPVSGVGLGHHTATWIVIGQPPADGIPQIAIGMDN